MDSILPQGPTWYYNNDQKQPFGGAILGEGYLRRMEEWRENMRAEAIRLHNLNPEVTEVQRYISFLQGEQWAGMNWPRYRSRFVNNMMDRARTDSISQLTSGKPTIDVQSSVVGYESSARIAMNVIHGEWVRQSFDLALASLVDIAQLWGTGFWRITSAKPGVMKMHAYGPDMVFPIRPQFHLQDSLAVLFRTYKGPEYFRRKFPMLSANIEREFFQPDTPTMNQYLRPNSIAETTWNALSPGMRRIVGVRAGMDNTPNQKVFPVIELQEFTVEDESINESRRHVLVKDPWLPIDQHDWWYIVPPGGRLYPRKRLIIFGGRRLMYDGPAPDFHGLFPYVKLSLDPVPWSFWGKSYYRNLLPLNININKIGGGVMDIIQRALAPTVVSRLNSVSKPAWDKFFPDAPGQKLLLNGSGNPANDVQYMDTPEIPAYVQQFLGQYLMPEFDKHAGTMDMTQIAGKKQAPGGDTIEQMRDTMQSAYQLKGRYIERALTDAGTLAVSNVFQYYTQAQRMKLLGEDGLTLQDFDFDPGTLIPSGLTREQKMIFWKNFAMTILPGSLHSGAQDRQKLIQTNLFGMGAISRGQLLRTLEIGDPEKIQKELNEEKTQDILAQGRAQMLIQNQSAMAQLGQQLAGALPSPGGGGEMPQAEDPQASARLSRGARNGETV